jgi:hypothetical protein
MKISRTGSTPMQKAYAMRVWGAKGSDKKSIARDVGYSPYVARSATSKIEGTKGFQNAIIALAKDSNNLALAAMAEFKARGLKGFSNKDLVGALNAISGAWSKFNTELKAETKPMSESGNRLRQIVLNKIETQTIVNNPEPEPEQVKGDGLDF